MIRILLPAAAAIVVLSGAVLSLGPQPAGADPPKVDADEPDDDVVMDPLGANAACYVCHIPLVKGELSKVHLKAKITCIKCHGLSADHANDEDIGATKPDIRFARKQVDRMCRKCHKKHDVPAWEVVARFVDRGISPKGPVVCTDCHGTHRIEPPPEEDPPPK